MYIKNKLGIYVYPNGVYYINNVSWKVNSISHTELILNKKTKFRYINEELYGILLTNEKLYKK